MLYYDEMKCPFIVTIHMYNEITSNLFSSANMQSHNNIKLNKIII